VKAANVKEWDRLEAELTYAQAAVPSLKDRYLTHEGDRWWLRHFRAEPIGIHHTMVPEDIYLGDTSTEALSAITRLYDKVAYNV
jgi:hypothetical protein